MELSHSWRWRMRGTDVAEAFESLAQDARLLCRESGLSLAGATEPEPMRFDSEMTAFAPGDFGPRTGTEGLDFMDEDERGDALVLAVSPEGAGRCNTYDAAYGDLVMAVLIRAAIRLPGMYLLSSGEWDEEWANARAVVERYFGECPTRIPLNESDALEEPEAPSWLRWRESAVPGVPPELLAVGPINVVSDGATEDREENVALFTVRVDGSVPLPIDSAVSALDGALGECGFTERSTSAVPHSTGGYPMTVVSATAPGCGLRLVVIDRLEAGTHLPHPFRKVKDPTAIRMELAQSVALRH